MEIDFQEGCEKLQNLIFRIRDALKIGDQASKTEQFEKIVSEFFKDSSDCEYLAGVVQMFSQTAEMLSTPEAKKKYDSVRGKVFEDDIITHPLYTSLYFTSLQLEKENKYLKQSSGEMATFANALAKSETDRNQLVQQNAKLATQHKAELEAQNRAVHELTRKLLIAEEQVQKLTTTNQALSKRGKGQAEALNNEILKLTSEIRTKTEQIQMIEDQGRQTSMMLTNEMNDLKAKLANALKSQPKKSGEVADDVNLANKICANLLASLKSKQQFISEIIGPETESADLLKSAEKQLDSVRKEFEERKANIENVKQQISQKEDEIKTLSADTQNLAQETQTAQQNLIDSETKVTQLSSEKEAAEKELSELNQKLATLATDKEEKEQQLGNVKNEIQQKKNESQTVIENVERLENEIRSFNETLSQQKQKIEAATTSIDQIEEKKNELRNRIGNVLKNLNDQLQQADA